MKSVCPYSMSSHLRERFDSFPLWMLRRFSAPLFSHTHYRCAVDMCDTESMYRYVVDT